jgi:hypothetical protein
MSAIRIRSRSTDAAGLNCARAEAIRELRLLKPPEKTKRGLKQENCAEHIKINIFNAAEAARAQQSRRCRRRSGKRSPQTKKKRQHFDIRFRFRVSD